MLLSRVLVAETLHCFLLPARTESPGKCQEILFLQKALTGIATRYIALRFCMTLPQTCCASGTPHSMAGYGTPGTRKESTPIYGAERD